MFKRALFFTLLAGLALADFGPPIAGLLQNDHTAFDHRLAINSPDGQLVAFGT